MNRKQRRTLASLERRGVMRTEEQLRKEYTDLAANAGELQYMIEKLKGDLAQINQRMSGIHKENQERLAVVPSDALAPKPEAAPEATVAPVAEEERVQQAS